MAAFGLALRSIGHGKKVVIIQFMKGREDIGEYKAAERLGPECEIRQFGSREFTDLRNPSREDIDRARKGLEYAWKVLSGNPDLVILDELGLAASVGLVRPDGVEKLIQHADRETVIVITGRKVPQSIIDKADLVTDMRNVRHPKDSGVDAREGVEY